MKVGATITTERKQGYKAVKITANDHITANITNEKGEEILTVKIQDGITYEKGNVYKVSIKETATNKITELIVKNNNENLKHDRETCGKHGKEYMERNQVTGEYFCRHCVIDSLR